jgi:flagellar biosynthesis protein FlhF
LAPKPDSAPRSRPLEHPSGSDNTSLPRTLPNAAFGDTHSEIAFVSPTPLTCTKIDEAVCCGTIVAAHIQSGLPLGYFTTGQRVPEDLSVASAELLAGLLCGEDVN